MKKEQIAKKMGPITYNPKNESNQYGGSVDVKLPGKRNLRFDKTGVMYQTGEKGGRNRYLINPKHTHDKKWHYSKGGKNN